MSILQILENINADTKRSHKISIVENNKNNELFLKVTKAALDPYVNYFIRKIPEYNSNPNLNLNNSLEWALVELNKLSSRVFTGHAGINHLSYILSNISKDDAIVIERIIGKDLRCGLADGIINSVIDNHIPTYPCLLARAYDEKNIKNIKFPAQSELKADGLRVNFHIDGDKVTICGRSGRDIDLLGYMDNDLIELGKQFPYPIVVDGELVVVDNEGTVLSRKVGNGILNKSIKGTIGDDEAKMVRSQVWDIIPKSEFIQGKSKLTYENRFESLKSAIDAISDTPDATVNKLITGSNRKFWMIPYKIVKNLEEAIAHFQEMIAIGAEGTLLKNLKDNFWEDSRSKNLVKMKSERECDLRIVGFNPGTGKFDGMVGSLICESEDKSVNVSISGFSDELRQEITDKIDSILQSIVEVTYNERISSKGKDRSLVDSLFLPRFSRFRPDKNIANSSGEIK